jgi:hypothetical protein
MRGRLDWSYITSMTVSNLEVVFTISVDLLTNLIFHNMHLSRFYLLHWQSVMHDCYIKALCTSMTWYDLDLILTCLDEDHELQVERLTLFAGLPGFRNSKVIKDPLLYFTFGRQGELLNALMGLSDCTSSFSSDLLPESVKDRRAVICGKSDRSSGYFSSNPAGCQQNHIRGHVWCSERLGIWDNDEDYEIPII